MLGYKTRWNGGTLVIADRWDPSSSDQDKNTLMPVEE
jgi:hypothetical protein